MRQSFISLLFLTLFSVSAFAQKVTFKQIQQDNNYIYGVGTASTEAEASKLALDELVSSISTHVESKFDYVIRESGTDAQSDVMSRVKTYSKMTLSNVKKIDISKPKDKQRSVVRYITQSDLEKMFEERGNKVKNYVSSARRAAKREQVGTALHNYYWALSLLGSYPDGDKLQVEDEDFHSQYAYTWIPEQMKKLMSKISMNYVNVEKDEDEKIVRVEVNYDGKPADDVSFTCSDTEGSESELVSTKNGVGEIYLPAKAKEKKLVATIDYRGIEEANRDAELADVIDACGMAFKEASINLGRDIKKKQQTTYADVEMAKVDVVKMNDPKATVHTASKAEAVDSIVRYLNPKEAASYIPVAQQIEKILRSRQFDQLKALCTDEGWSHVQKLLQYGSARMVGNPNIQFLDNNGDVTVRSYPMSFQFKSNKRKFNEDVVFHLNREGKITQLAFALDKRSADDILCHRGEWSDQAKQTIVNFMESYKTAYALRDIDYIDRIFSDDALILVGHVVKVSPKKSEMQPTNLQHVEYIRKSKKEYMKSLEKAFSSNEYINLKFGDTYVNKSGFTNRTTGQKMEVYGIQLRQDYFSQTYGDTGYLFLAVDLTDANNPLIHVRTWQPEKDVTNGEQFGLNSF